MKNSQVGMMTTRVHQVLKCYCCFNMAFCSACCGVSGVEWSLCSFVPLYATLLFLGTPTTLWVVMGERVN